MIAQWRNALTQLLLCVQLLLSFVLCKVNCTIITALRLFPAAENSVLIAAAVLVVCVVMVLSMLEYASAVGDGTSCRC